MTSRWIEDSECTELRKLKSHPQTHNKPQTMSNADEAHKAIALITEHFLDEDYPEELVRMLEAAIEDYYQVERDKHGAYNDRD